MEYREVIRQSLVFCHLFVVQAVGIRQRKLRKARKPRLVGARTSSYLRLVNIAQWTIRVGEIARAQCLNTSMMISVEWSHSSAATRRVGCIGRTKPKTNVIGVYWPGCRVDGRIRKRSVVVHYRCRTGTRSHDESFD